MGEAKANALSVRLELQSDCFAGIWGHSANADSQLVEAGDIDEALNAASTIGDDRLQKQVQGYVVAESFTHGTPYYPYLAAAGQTGQHSSHAFPSTADTYKIRAYLPR